MKYDVTAIWTRSFIKTISVEAADEDAASEQVREELDRAIASQGVPLDQSTWVLDSEDIDIESVDPSESPGEDEGEPEVVP